MQKLKGLAVLAGLFVSVLTIGHFAFILNTPEQYQKLSQNNTVYLVGEIDPGTVKSLTMQLNQVHRTLPEGTDSINIIINSPGGRVDSGDKILALFNEQKLQGLKINCYVKGQAYSMAALLLTECDRRYATYDSRIMWHSVATMGFMRLNETTAEGLLANLRHLNDKMLAKSKRYFFPWSSFFEESFATERRIPPYTLQANTFRYIKVIRDVTIIEDEKHETKQDRKNK